MLNIFLCAFGCLYVFFEECLLRSSAHFWLVYFFLDIECMSCSYILEVNTLLVASFANIFFHSVDCLLVYGFLCCAKALSLIRFYLIIFVFISIALGNLSKKILLQLMSKSVLPMFSFESFIVFGLTFRPLIHFEY